MNLQEIAGILNGEIISGADLEIERLSKIEDAGPGDITFFANPKYAKHLLTTCASAVLISFGVEQPEIAQRKTPIHVVRVPDAYMAFLRLVEEFYPAPKPVPKGIHPSAVISSTSTISANCAVAPNVVIGEYCKIGEGVTLHPGVVLGDYVEIGNNSVLYSNVSVREGCKIGTKTIIHSGAVIGSDGFGFAPTPDGTYQKIPQRGIVVLEDNVEIGSNCTIDRATIGETRLKNGVKLDNLIHVAHNVIIGENTVVAAQTGISGSTKIGKNCIIGGQVGIIGHLTITDKTIIAAQSGIPKSITESGKTFFGSPAKEHGRALRIEGAVRQLPEMLVEMRSLRNEVERLSTLLNEKESIKQ